MSAEWLSRNLTRVARWLDSRNPANVYANAARTPTRLHNLLKQLDRKLVVADIGCRWGFADQWLQLAPHVTLYGFDPDATECERLQTFYQGKDVTLVAQALADVPSLRKLYLTKEPACSSLYRPDPNLTSTTPELACATEIGTKDIAVTTLDIWAENAGVFVVDFVKLDTQGAELEILRGGAKTLDTVRALEVEVEFNPIYESQPLFGNIDQYLRDRGFVLWRLANLAHYSRWKLSSQPQIPNHVYYDSVAAQHATRGGQLFWGNAFYVRAEIAAASNSGDIAQARLDSALMLALGFDDLATNLLHAFARNGL